MTTNIYETDGTPTKVDNLIASHMMNKPYEKITDLDIKLAFKKLTYIKAYRGNIPIRVKEILVMFGYPPP